MRPAALFCADVASGPFQGQRNSRHLGLPRHLERVSPIPITDVVQIQWAFLNARLVEDSPSPSWVRYHLSDQCLPSSSFPGEQQKPTQSSSKKSGGGILITQHRRSLSSGRQERLSPVRDLHLASPREQSQGGPYPRNTFPSPRSLHSCLCSLCQSFGSKAWLPLFFSEHEAGNGDSTLLTAQF